MREVKKIEAFFLLALLRISIAGVALILVTDLIFYPEDKLSIIIDCVILATLILAYAMRKRFFTVSVLLVTCVTLAAMFYQCVAVPMNTTTSFSVILIVAFIFSILLNGWLLWVMHGITWVGLILIFIGQASLSVGPAENLSDLISIAVTYLILYVILTLCTVVLKQSYDRIHLYLRSTNTMLKEKTNEVALRNEELLQIQDNLNALNVNLERMVSERTEKIKEQNEILIKYTYTNAHHLRAPVARLLGLVQIHRLEPSPDIQFYLETIESQVKEIDTVVKQINSELENNSAGNM